MVKVSTSLWWFSFSNNSNKYSDTFCASKYVHQKYYLTLMVLSPKKVGFFCPQKDYFSNVWREIELPSFQINSIVLWKLFLLMLPQYSASCQVTFVSYHNPVDPDCPPAVRVRYPWIETASSVTRPSWTPVRDNSRVTSEDNSTSFVDFPNIPSY